MATTTTFFRMKMTRKFGIPFWPWRRLNSKNAKILTKINRKMSRQVHQQDMKRKKSPFFHQTRIKKLMGLLYGKLSRAYLVALYKKCVPIQGNPLHTFLSALETRVDIILYRLQFAPTIQAARQLILHRNVCVNSAVITKSGYTLEPGDVISIAPKSLDYVATNIQRFLHASNTHHGHRRPALVKQNDDSKTRKRFLLSKRKLAIDQKLREIQKRVVRYTTRLLRLRKTFHEEKGRLKERKQLTPILSKRMRVKMRVLVCKAKRQEYFRVRMKHENKKTRSRTHATRLMRPSAGFSRVRFQRTAKNMPVKKWLFTLAVKNQCFWLKKNVLSVKTTNNKIEAILQAAKEKEKASRERKEAISKILAARKAWGIRRKWSPTRNWSPRNWSPTPSSLQRSFRKKQKKYPFRFFPSKMFYKPTHLEVNYHTLQIVLLFTPEQLYYPVKLDPRSIIGAYQR